MLNLLIWCREMYLRAAMQHAEYFNSDSKNNDKDSEQLFHKRGFSHADNIVAQIQQHHTDETFFSPRIARASVKSDVFVSFCLFFFFWKRWNFRLPSERPRCKFDPINVQMAAYHGWQKSLKMQLSGWLWVNHSHPRTLYARQPSGLGILFHLSRERGRCLPANMHKFHGKASG